MPTAIEWTDETWNPIVGCSIASSGCKNCYAMRMAGRLEAMGVEKYVGTTTKIKGRSVWTGKIRFDEKALLIPYSWKRPRNVFVNSMSDLFHDDVPIEWVREIFGVMRGASAHTFQVLTKRAERMLELTSDFGIAVPANVWLGVSVENANFIDRLNSLRNVQARVRFASFEPLIGPVGEVDLSGIHWAIVGGESGPRSRPMKSEWVEEIQAACRRYDAAFFFKQWGGVNKKRAGRVFAGRHWDEQPIISAVGP